MHQTADSFSCSRPENHGGDHPCNGAFFSICCFISDSIYSRQKVQEVGSSRTASCLRGCLAWFMCMKTDSYQCVGSCYLSWLKPRSVHYMRSLKKTWVDIFSKHLSIPLTFLHAALDGIPQTSNMRAYLSFTSEYLIFCTDEFLLNCRLLQPWLLIKKIVWSWKFTWDICLIWSNFSWCWGLCQHLSAHESYSVTAAAANTDTR